MRCVLEWDARLSEASDAQPSAAWKFTGGTNYSDAACVVTSKRVYLNSSEKNESSRLFVASFPPNDLKNDHCLIRVNIWLRLEVE